MRRYFTVFRRVQATQSGAPSTEESPWSSFRCMIVQTECAACHKHSCSSACVHSVTVRETASPIIDQDRDRANKSTCFGRHGAVCGGGFTQNPSRTGLDWGVGDALSTFSIAMPAFHMEVSCGGVLVEAHVAAWLFGWGERSWGDPRAMRWGPIFRQVYRTKYRRATGGRIGETGRGSFLESSVGRL